MTGSAGTVGYATDTGRRLWVAEEAASRDELVAVTGDGSTVLVTGSPERRGRTGPARTVAYDAATGHVRWSSDGAFEQVVALGSSSRTGLVYVSGTSRAGGSQDLVTVAYRAADGKTVWTARYDGPAHGDEGYFPTAPQALAVSGDGTAIYVTTGSTGIRTRTDYATLAYDAESGKRLWVSRYDGPAHGDDLPAALVASPAGIVVVTGASTGPGGQMDAATVAYRAADGRQVWVRRYDGPAGHNDGGAAIALSGNGDSVYVAGTSEGASVQHEDAVTQAYTTATGKKLWAARYDGTGADDNAAGVVVGGTPERVIMMARSTGSPAQTLSDFATVAYDARTGHESWSSRFVGHGEGKAVGITPDGSRVIVAGWGDGTGMAGPGYVVLAYRNG